MIIAFFYSTHTWYLWYTPGTLENDFTTTFGTGTFFIPLYLPYPMDTIMCIASSKCLSAASSWHAKAAED